MEIAVQSLNRYNCNQLITQFEKQVQDSDKIIFNFRNLYNLDKLGLKAFLELEKRAIEMGKPIFVIGRENTLLNEFMRQLPMT